MFRAALKRSSRLLRTLSGWLNLKGISSACAALVGYVTPYIVRIAAELFRVVAYPRQRSRGVKHAGGARSRVLFAEQIAEVNVSEQI